MAATPGTITVPLVVDDAALRESLIASLEGIIADLRKAPEPEPASPRFHAAELDGNWGVFDAENPTKWAPCLDRVAAVRTAERLNAGTHGVDDWYWETIPSAEPPRFSVVTIDGTYGILDRDNPGVWAYYWVTDPEGIERDAEDLNNGDDPADWEWTPLPLPATIANLDDSQLPWPVGTRAVDTDGDTWERLDVGWRLVRWHSEDADRDHSVSADGLTLSDGAHYFPLTIQ